MKIEEDNIFEPENIKKAAEEYEVMSASSDQFVAAVKEAVADGRVIIDADYGHLESDELQEEIEKVLQPGNFFPCPPEMTQKLIEGIGVVGSTLTAKVADCQDPWIYFGRLLSHISCWKCGTRLHWKYDGKHLKLLSWKSHPEISDIIESDAPCPFAKGLTPIVVNLPVPSGKLVIGNDLRYLFTEEMIWGPKGSSDRFRSENSINH